MTPCNQKSFSRADKVRKRSEYLSVYRRARPMHTSNFVFYALEEDGKRSRLGCTVSKKIGNAVVRNRVKRLIKEVFRNHRDWFRNGTVLVVNAKKKAAAARHADVTADFKKVADRLGEEKAV